jgi:hypothetical protein
MNHNWFDFQEDLVTPFRKFLSQLHIEIDPEEGQVEWYL